MKNLKRLRSPNSVQQGLRWLIAAAFLTIASNAQAAPVPFSVTTSVDENGHGTLTNTDGAFSTLPAGLENDPGPGGLANVLTYGLLSPPGLTAGDVFLQDGVGGKILDVVRFNPTESCFGTTGCLVFYSDNLDGFDSLADTTGPPIGSYANTVTILEIGTETNNGATYTPVAGQPGFVADAGGPVTYNLRSDGPLTTPVPEPTTLALLGSALIGIAGPIARRRRRQ
ncbi:MAG TPA: PEP-CTERM sorting domain-containing protein [Vicinamibacterales bacterium]|nr:PEP-CTERM sorting domain-containing protein [Vicinamibacterales bacterium]